MKIILKRLFLLFLFNFATDLFKFFLFLFTYDMTFRD